MQIECCMKCAMASRVICHIHSLPHFAIFLEKDRAFRISHSLERIQERVLQHQLLNERSGWSPQNEESVFANLREVSFEEVRQMGDVHELQRLRTHINELQLVLLPFS